MTEAIDIAHAHHRKSDDTCDDQGTDKASRKAGAEAILIERWHLMVYTTLKEVIERWHNISNI